MKKESAKDVFALLAEMANDDYCYVTTTGRRSGNPHEIEIWFGVEKSCIYLISGDPAKTDWVKNMRANPNVTVRIGKQTFKGAARFEMDEKEDGRVRKMMATKYQGWRAGRKFSEWAGKGLVVGIDLTLINDQ